MKNLENAFKNFLDTKNVSDINLKKFTETHIQRLTANNGGGTFTTSITDTVSAYTNYFGNMSGENIAFAVQQGLTVTVNNIIKEFKKDVRQKEGLIRSSYNVDAPAYQEFFPHGVSEYIIANKNRVDQLMKRMTEACIAHAADLGAAIGTLFSNHYTNYGNARKAQLLKMAEVSSGKTGTAGARTALEIQLLKNLFFIGFNFPGDVDKCMDFYDQSIIRYKIKKKSDGKGRVVGNIKDSASGLPVVKAVFQFLGTNVRASRSNNNGKLKTRKVPVGNYQARITAKGKPEKLVDIFVKDDGDTNLDVEM